MAQKRGFLEKAVTYFRRALTVFTVMALFPGAAESTITEIIDINGDGAGNPLYSPFEIAVDGLGNVYVAGFRSHNAFKIDALGIQGDSDGVPDHFDNCPFVSNPAQDDDDADDFFHEQRSLEQLLHQSLRLQSQCSHIENDMARSRHLVASIIPQIFNFV